MACLSAIFPVVSVPVLSQHSTSMLPRSSTDASFFVMTFSRAILSAPAERVRVMMTGSTSGVMPTAIAMAKRKEGKMPLPSSAFVRKTNSVMAMMTRRRKALNRRIFRWKSPACGVFCRCAAVLPKNVRIPVNTTTPVAEPDATEVPMKAMFPRYCGSGLSASSGAMCFGSGTLSPVSELSSTEQEFTCSSLMSAGTMSPTPRWTMSPGTSDSLSVSRTVPARSTVTRSVR